MGEVTRYLTTSAEVEALCKAAHAEGARQERERERENTIAIEGAGIRWDEVDADMKYEGRCVAVKIERGKVEHDAALARVRAEGARQEQERIRGRALTDELGRKVGRVHAFIIANAITPSTALPAEPAWRALLAAITEGE